MLLHYISNAASLTTVKDSVIDLGSVCQSQSLLHHCRNSIFTPVKKEGIFNQRLVPDRNYLHNVKIVFKGQCK